MIAWRALTAAVALAAGALPAVAQTFPSKTVHLVVAYAPGGTGDVVARIIADKLGTALGQTVVVENRAGASGAIGATSVLNAAPDGHTLLLGQTGEIVVNQFWMKGLTYDPKDLMPVALATVVPLALTVPGKAPYTTMAEMLNAIQTSGKPFSFASAGTGTPGHFAGEYLSAKLPGKLVHVPTRAQGRRSTTSSAATSTCISRAFPR
jgi:tripartite-type tricarboxylate transporter receptor subunit TctC